MTTHNIDNEQDMIYLMAQIGHEIRTPLNAVKGFGELLLGESCGDLNELQKKYLTKMLDSSDKLLNIVEMILQWAKFKNNQIALNKQQINLSHLVLESIDLFGLDLKEKQITLNLDVQKNVTIFADKDKLREVIINIVNNALKFTAQNGSISVKLTDDGEEVILAISDTGCGMSESELEKIFLPFVKTNVNNNNGTGLGLWISKVIIEMHGGLLYATSKKEEGSCFYIKLAKNCTL